MPILFRCPYCGMQTNVADHFAGQSGPCAGCGKMVTVPGGAAAVAYAPPAKSSAAPVLIAVLAVVLVVAVGCGGILLALLLPAVQAAREAARRATCINNMKQIGLALHSYHDTYRCFPPAYIPDEKGQPKHSWRVLILPYLDQKSLYDRYNFDEPWDSPNNMAVAAHVPPEYRCPSDSTSGPNATDYVMIVGPGTISEGPTAHRISDIVDGSSNTIMLVESSGSKVPWTKPHDLDATAISYDLNDSSGGGIRSEHSGGVVVLFCDGAVHFISRSTEPDEMAAMTTIGGGEMVSPLYLQFGGGGRGRRGGGFDFD